MPASGKEESGRFYVTCFCIIDPRLWTHAVVCCPFLDCCRDEIFQVIEADIPMNEGGAGYAPFSVRMLLQYNVLDNFDQIRTISGMASKEFRRVLVAACDRRWLQ